MRRMYSTAPRQSVGSKCVSCCSQEASKGTLMLLQATSPKKPYSSSDSKTSFGSFSPRVSRCASSSLLLLLLLLCLSLYVLLLLQFDVSNVFTLCTLLPFRCRPSLSLNQRLTLFDLLPLLLLKLLLLLKVLLLLQVLLLRNLLLLQLLRLWSLLLLL